MSKKFDMDDSYDLMIDFMKTMRMNNAGIGNIYVIKRFSKDGELLDVKFCKNMMTDYGVSQFFISDRSFPLRLFIGDAGEGSFNHTTSSILSPITDSYFDTSNPTPAYNYPLYYDKTSGLITVVSRAMQFKIPSTISGIVDEKSITEYGIGTSINELWTHSWVYTTKGARGSITKKPEEILNIDVFFCLSYYESMIIDNWNNGRYTLITTMKRFFDKMKGIPYTYKRGNVGITRANTTTMSGFVNNEIIRYTNITAFTIMYSWSTGTSQSDKDENLRNGYFDGFCDWCSGFMSIERELLYTPEAFDVIVKPNSTEDSSLSDRFGQHDQNGVPFSQCTIASSYLFNPNTNAWDIAETFVNDPNKWYCETPLETKFATPLYYSNNNTIQTVYVYQNIQTDDPINSFDINLETVYACEKYWDRKTWHLITNLIQVPDADTNEFGHYLNCQTAKYYITTHNDISLVPHRSSEGFVILPDKGRSETLSFPASDYVNGPVCDNYQFKWYKWKERVYDVQNGNVYTMGNSDNETMTYDKWMCIFQSENNIVNYANMTNLSTQPELTKLTLPFSKNTNMLTQCIRSESGTGLITLQSTTVNESFVLKLGDTITNTQYTTTKMCAIYGTERIAYIDKSDTNHVQVYEFGSTNAVIATFELPTGFAPNVIFGHTDYVYVISTSSSNFMLCFNINNKTLSQCSMNMSSLVSTPHYFKLTCVDNCLVAYRRDLYKASQAYWINMSHPTEVDSLEGLGEFSYGPSSYTLRKIHQDAIVLLYNTRNTYSGNQGSNNVIADMGNFMRGNKTYTISFNGSSEETIIPYGEYFIRHCNQKRPFENCMPHRIIGTTRCITSVNGYKNIRNKQFYTKFTNIAKFQGLPPGEKQ